MGGFFSRPSRPAPPPPPPPPPPQEDPKVRDARERRLRGKVRGMGYGQGSTLGGGEDAATARTILGQ
tara:strand:- start:680 stop:880 length:201 start_codon:yes stop_codon:yes gene_type:complete